MKPAPFEYVRADDLTTALEVLATSEARVLAGGQSLVPLMNLRLARPATLVDVNRLVDLDQVVVQNGNLVLGALCRHRRLEVDPLVADRTPLLAEVAANIGYPAVRNRGSLGGSLAHGDPAAELAAALMVLEGRVRVRSATAEREIAAHDLFTGFFTTSIAEDELLVDVTVPIRVDGEGSAFVEFAPRLGDFAVVGVAARIVLDAEGRCTLARAASCGAASTSVDLSPALTTLVGETALSDALLGDVAAAVPAHFEPVGDLEATPDDRRALTQSLTVEALRRAWSRAGGNG
jgi:carbon-monoxide dehydrogenase medium subunit